MNQERLNSVMILHVHKDKTDKIHSWTLLTNLSPMSLGLHNLGSSHNQIC